MSIRVLIVAAHPLFSEGLAACTSSALPDVTTDCAWCLDEAIAFSRAKSYGLVLLDLKLPDASGFSGLLALRNQLPNTAIVVVSALAAPSIIRNALVVGAAGFIAKAASKASIIRVLQGVLEMKRMIALEGERAGEGKEICQVIGIDRHVESLSKKQAAVLQMMCGGLFNKEIANALDLQPTTVKAHITEVLRKLRVISRTKAVIEVSAVRSEDALFRGKGSMPAAHSELRQVA